MARSKNSHVLQQSPNRFQSRASSPQNDTAARVLLINIGFGCNVKPAQLFSCKVEVTTHTSFGWCVWDALSERGISYSVFGAGYCSTTLHLLVMQLMMLPGVCMQVPQALEELSEQSELFCEVLVRATSVSSPSLPFRFLMSILALRAVWT